jgi:peptidyl-dipeptidase Dcp
MHRPVPSALLLATLAALAAPGCTGKQVIEPEAAEAAMATEAPVRHPLAAPWEGPYGGVPPLDRVEVAELGPALRSAMAAERRAIDAITADPAPPTFDNTLVPFERASAELDRVDALYGIWTSSLSDAAVRALELEIEPELAAHRDAINLDPALLAPFCAVYGARESLTPEQQRLAWKFYTRFRRAGAELAPADRERVAAINQQLSGLFTKFSQNLLADEEGYVLVLETGEDLAGLPEGLRASASAAAEERNNPGKWAITNTRSSMDPFLTFSDRRDLREKVWRAYYGRGDNGDEHDNNEIITQILALRAERAALLGYETHAHYRLEEAMAGTPDRAMALMEQVWPAALARVREEVADMQAIADQELGEGEITIEPWDYRYYAEKVRKDRYDLDQNEVKPYLQLEKLREGMFWAANQLYGLSFEPVTDVPVPSPDIRVWKVLGTDGALVGLWYFDPYARPGKRSGAWMNAYRVQQRLDGDIRPIVSNNANFVKGAPGQPVLVSWDDAETLFHEFGHAIHGLLSDVTYPTLAGTNVSRDFVEFPSQLNERWLATPEVLSRFALHVETGEPIPDELVERIEKAATFNQGFATAEYLASALVDMKLHLAGATPIDPDAFERDTLAELGMPDEVVMRHRTPQFAHVFAGDGYSAGYYSYLWADTLTADAAEAFVEAGGFYDGATADRLREAVLSAGNTRDPAEAWRAFRGRDVDVGALMRARGFPAEPQD